MAATSPNSPPVASQPSRSYAGPSRSTLASSREVLGDGHAHVTVDGRSHVLSHDDDGGNSVEGRV